MVYTLKRAINSVVTLYEIMQRTARGVDYRTLNAHILKINELQDINDILYEVSTCLKTILNTELFGFAVKNDDALEVWIDPRAYKGHFIEIIQKDFNCQSVDAFHYFDNKNLLGSRNTDDIISNVHSYKVSDKDYIARLYVLPRKKLLSHHAEIINIIIETVRIVLDNAFTIKKLENAASIDPLTNCFNRRALGGCLDHDIAVAQRYGGDLSVIMFDIDHFKRINDTYGHQAGDGVLRELSRMVLSSIRKSDYLSRYGGEEFVLVLPNTKLRFAAELAERLRLKIQASPVASAEQPIAVTASFGVAALGKAADRNLLLSEADTMLYRAKASGRNTVCFEEKVTADNAA
ncbi:MAG: GGDEF domain-containing protein [Nitrospirota bacterium]